MRTYFERQTKSIVKKSQIFLQILQKKMRAEK